MKSTPTAASHNRLPGLDTLRSLAILLVIPSHAKDYLKWHYLKVIGQYGGVGVDLFFVLSGFLIGSQLFQSLELSGRVDFKQFYIKRSLRILPSYLVVVFLYQIWPDFRETPQMVSIWKFLTFTMNFGTPPGRWAFSHAWSLCIEEHFYLVFPAIIAWCALRARKWLPIGIIGSILLGEILLRYYLWLIDESFYRDLYRPTYAHLDGLTVGVALALIRVYRSSFWDKLTQRPWLVFILGAALIWVGTWTLENERSVYNYMFTFSLMAFGFGAFVVAAQAPHFWLARWRIPGAATTATLAYTLYLTHKQMIHLTTQLVDPSPSNWILTLTVATTLVLLASGLLHVLVERPCLRLRDRLLPHIN